MLDRESLTYGRELAWSECEAPAQLAEIGLLGGLRAGLAEPDFDLSVGGDRDVVLHADPDWAAAVIFYAHFVGDVDGAGAPKDCLARGAPGELAVDSDLIVDAELELELLAGRDGLQPGLARELAVEEDPCRPGQQQERRAVGDLRAQIGLWRDQRNREVVDLGVEVDPGDRRLVRAAVGRDRERPRHAVDLPCSRLA